MVYTIFAAVVCISAVAAQYPTGYASPQGGAYNPGSYSTNNAYGINIYDVQVLGKNISALDDLADDIDKRLSILEAENEQNSIFQEFFSNDFYSNFNDGQAAQNAKLDDLEDAAVKLLNLKDELAVIETIIYELNKQVAKANATKSLIESEIADVQAEDASQADRLEAVKNKIKENNFKLDELEEKARRVQKQIKQLFQTLEDVYFVLNSEFGQDLLFFLTESNTEGTGFLDHDFNNGRLPSLQYGVSAIKATKEDKVYTAQYSAGSYGAGYQVDSSYPEISWNIDVSFSFKKGEVFVKLYDLSQNGWKIKEVQFRVSVYRIDPTTIVNLAAY